MSKPIKDLDPMKAMLIRYWWQEDEDALTIYPQDAEELQASMRQTVQTALDELRAELLSNPPVAPVVPLIPVIPPESRPDFIRVKDIPISYANVTEKTVRWWIQNNTRNIASCLTRKGRSIFINRKKFEKYLAE